MIRPARAVLLTLALAACQTGAGDDLPPVGAEAVEAARTACERRGGTFAPGGISGALACFTTPRDAGKQCSTADDCSSACLARSRTCAPVTPLFGCNEVLTSTGARVTQCID